MDQVSAWMAEISPGIRISAELLPVTEKAKLAISYSGKESLLLIENPESHLHPKGQTMIAKLIFLAANHGCQIICESHSDHVINGVRVAVKNGWINHKKVGVSFLSKNKVQETKVDSIYVDEKRNLSDYPYGLLDEWGILMTELI